jgi:two-component system, OmpR family, sensor kinase
MVDESDRLIRLVNDLLTLARAEAGRRLAIEPLPVPSLLEEARRFVHQAAPERVIHLDAPAGLTIQGERDAFKQILLFALDNALKHSSGEIAVTTKRAGDRVEIQVVDHGEGISSEKLAHIFDRFYRGEESSTIPGFGLGLPIARALVEAQGGEIEMQSEPGVGSVLRLRMPGA